MRKKLAWILLITCVLPLAGCASAQQSSKPQSGDSPKVLPLAVAQYPEMAPYPNEQEYMDEVSGTYDGEGFSQAYDAWRQSKDAQLAQPEGYAEGLDSFFMESSTELLSGAQGQNKIYAPLNLCMGLSMLAEITGGSSRQQILDLLGAENIENLREQANAIWNANYCDDGAVTSVLANSLWLNQEVDFIQETMDTLAEKYYASSYQGEMGSDALNQALQQWIDQQTGGLLQEQAKDLEMDPETILTLATTIYFRAKWVNEFSESETAQGQFYPLGASGEGISCDFMHQKNARDYYWGDGFSAVAQPLEGSGSLWLLLPDEGVSVDQLLEKGTAMEFFLANGDWENRKSLMVNLSVPKFDVGSSMDLNSGLKNLGLTEVFDPNGADFSPMTANTKGIALSRVEHAARVCIDEKGVEAAAFTVMMATGTSMPPEEEIDFTVDRPFLFAIMGRDGLPLFVGVVNAPA